MKEKRFGRLVFIPGASVALRVCGKSHDPETSVTTYKKSTAGFNGKRYFLM